MLAYLLAYLYLTPCILHAGINLVNREILAEKGRAGNEGAGAWPPEPEFADRLAMLRRLRRASNEEIAEAAGVHPNTVSNWNGGQVPEGIVLLRLARYFDVSPDWLLTGKEAPTAKLPPQREKSHR